MNRVRWLFMDRSSTILSSVNYDSVLSNSRRTLGIRIVVVSEATGFESLVQCIQSVGNET